MLPPPDQVWSHGTNSFAQFSEAIQDPSITAIEADIVMGRDISGTDKDSIVPVMSHPPLLESDLSAATFLDGATNSKGERILTKHLKLDFKDFEAVEPTLKVLKSLKVNGNGRTVYLNADILDGPGKSSMDVTVQADEFVQKCLQLIASDGDESSQVDYAFSLGFKVEVHSPWGHTEDHLREMESVMRRHDLTGRCAGVVLAINARLLCKNTQPFERFLIAFPETQILVWTGSTEPPISTRKLIWIRNRFVASGHSHLVGFDCKVAETLLLGLMWDFAVDLYGLYVFICKALGVSSISASYKPKDS